MAAAPTASPMTISRLTLERRQVWRWMASAELSAALRPELIWPAVVLVLMPLLLAALSERWIEARPGRGFWRDRLAWWPVPLLAVVVFLIAGAQVGAVIGALALLPVVVPLFMMFLLLTGLIARGLAHALQLPLEQGRTLAFSLGTRNSFIVLPFALALPTGWELAAVVIVVQSLVELFGMLLYLWWLPSVLFPTATKQGRR